MRRKRIIDFFCCGGGAGEGYRRAGFDVVGVDIASRPLRYNPHPCIQADAFTFPLTGFDAAHASPPCQEHSQLHSNYGAPADGTGWMLMAIIKRLEAWGGPYVVENVVGAQFPWTFQLCGASFGLGASGLDLNRHRRFKVNFPIEDVPQCCHRRGQTIGVYGNGTNRWHREKLGRDITVAEQRKAMGIDWLPRDLLVQAIPPAYTEYIGRQLLASLE